MTEITFEVETASESGFVARAFEASIVSQADDLNELQACVRDAVECHFEADERPQLLQGRLR